MTAALVREMPHKHPPKGKVPLTCTSRHCVGASHRFYTNMNTTADPCVDFEEFACGRFLQNAQIPEDKGKLSEFTSKLPDTVYKRGRLLLEAEDRDEEWELFKTAKKFYKSCMMTT